MTNSKLSIALTLVMFFNTSSQTFLLHNPANLAIAISIDFGPYMASVQTSIKRHWFPPESLEPKKVSVKFKISKEGALSELTLGTSCGSVFGDHAALEAVRSAAPFEQLPSGAPEFVDISFTFDYNVHTSPPSVLENNIRKIEARSGDQRKPLAAEYLALGNSYAVQNNDAKAAEAFNKSETLNQALYGKGSLQVVEVWDRRVRNLYTAKRKFAEGQTLLKSLEAQIPANNMLALAALKNTQAQLIELPQDHFAAAESLLRSAATMAKSANNPSIYNKYLTALASCYVRSKNTPKAVLLLNDRVREILASSSPDKEELTSMAGLLIELNSVELRNSTKAIALAQEVHQALAAKYGELSQQALAGLYLCVTAARASGDSQLEKQFITAYRQSLGRAHLQIWEKALKHDQSRDNFLGYANCLAELGKTKEAEDEYRKALTIFPGDTGIKVKLDQLLTPVSPRVTTAVTKNRQEAILQNNRGVDLLKQERYEESLKCFLKALEASPDYQIPKTNMAIAYNNLAIHKTKPQEVLHYIDRCLYIEPTNKTALGNAQTAIKSMGLNPNKFEDRVTLGDKALAANDLVQARIEYLAALTIKHDDALSDKVKALPPPPDMPIPAKEVVQESTNNYITSWQRQIESTPNSAEAHLGLALEWLKVKELSKAEDELQIVLKLEPQNQTAKDKLEALKLARENEKK